MTKNDDLWAELSQKLNLDWTKPINSLKETELKVSHERKRRLEEDRCFEQILAADQALASHEHDQAE